MKQETEALAVQQQPFEQVPPANLFQALVQISTTPGVGIDVVERVAALLERQEERQSQKEFAQSLMELQAECPQIQKSGVILAKDKVTVRSRYSLIEDIDVIIRPLLQKHGFSVSFNEESVTGDNYRISCTLLHKSGHSVTKFITLPLDKNEFRTRMQDRKSTESFAHRNLLCMHLNIVSRGKDNDGQGDGAIITEDQARDLQVLMDEVKQDIPRFLKYFGIEKVSDLPAKEFSGAIQDLERKRK